MQIKIYWDNKESEKLLKKVTLSLEELGLNDFIKVETTDDKILKKELWIKKQPALIIEEPSIDFKDVIFEWMIPDDDELKSMFISIIGGDSQIWCAPDDCSSWCSGC